ncbi:hypothetical protein [Chitinophaga sp.]|uniref:hypothetical protein n=1 Tax=Chitinophaga sp. TaxID=1869181 RepID=UPI0031DFB04F
MEYKFYRSYYFQNENTEINLDSLSPEEVYYRFYHEAEIGIDVGERHIDGKFDTVYYIGGSFCDIVNYHNVNFKDLAFFHTVERLAEFTVIVKTYKNYIFNTAMIVNCKNNYEEEKISIYNDKFELTEYREFLSINNECIVGQRIFLPSVWKLSKEDFY